MESLPSHITGCLPEQNRKHLSPFTHSPGALTNCEFIRHIPSGLHCPIKGDELYGSKADRLYLHAESLEFTHPVSKEKVTIEVKADFTQQWLPQPKAEQSV